MILIINYDLKGPLIGYEPLFAAIKSQGAWWRYLPSTWILAVPKTADEVYNAIQPNLKPGDFIIVATLTHGYEGWMPKDAWDWLAKNGLNSRQPAQMQIPGLPGFTPEAGVHG